LRFALLAPNKRDWIVKASRALNFERGTFVKFDFSLLKLVTILAILLLVVEHGAVCVLGAVLLEDNAPSNTSSQSDASDYSEIERRLTEFIEYEIKDKQIPAVSIALVADGRIVVAKGFGQSTVGGGPVTPDTVFRAGSVSKLFTDIAVMRLAAAGKVDIDADVRKYLPDFAPRNSFNTPITLRQLMSHQSGLVRESPLGHYFDDTNPSLADTVKSLNETALVYKPGTRTKYSNAGVSVAGLVVEQLAGKPFEEHVREVLLEPLEMKHSGFRHNRETKANLATGWMRSHHAPRFAAPDFALGTLPAGNLDGGMNDLSNFLIALLGGGKFHGKTIIGDETLKSMLEPCRASNDKQHLYGIGFGLGSIDGHRTFGHGGAVYGYATQLTGLPDDGVGVVASASLDGANGFTRRLTEYAVRLLLAQKSGKPLPEIETSQPLPGDLVRKLPGTYASGHRFARILDYHGKLYLHDDLFLKRLRKSDDGLVVDDAAGFGPSLSSDGDGLLMSDRSWQRIAEPYPPEAPERFKPLIGEYGWDHNPLYIYEDRGQLWALIEWFYFYPLTEIAPTVFAFPDEGLYHGEQLVFDTDGKRPASHVVAASVRFDRRHADIENGGTFRIRPRRSADELYKLAREATPPKEQRPRREPDLVDITKLDPTMRLDIRYATTNNFMGAAFYRQPRAFLQRTAAEALARVHRNLEEQGYGLLLHDAYRPWYVTKMFWEGTPPHLRDFVADPEEGSKHNRGCAVDLTLFDRATGEPVMMVASYDEMSPRSYPFYPGGTARQRWHRKLLRDAMQHEGFEVHPLEWWHFDYKDWEQYGIGNLSFEEIDAAAD
jgi:CubicO group peptidase (beta-lactamase class C family)/D-alanyl-D-alanine dipeptidase